MSPLNVPPALLRWVAGIDVATTSGSAAVDVPDHATTLLLRSDKRELIVVGPRTRAAYHVGAPGRSCVRVRMRPGRAQALLGRPLRDFADRALPLRALPGLDIDQLAADPITALEEAMAEWPEPPERLEQAAHLLVGATVATTAAQLHISERRLHTLFTAGTGLSPKHFARIDRVRTVLAGDAGRWSDIATTAGYYDQSHMTAEFRHFMGVPPAAFTAGRRPAATPCTGGGPRSAQELQQLAEDGPVVDPGAVATQRVGWIVGGPAVAAAPRIGPTGVRSAMMARQAQVSR